VSDAPPVEPKKWAWATTSGAVLALVSSAIVGGWLMTKGWVFLGFAAVFCGFLSSGSSLRPRRLAEGFVSLFWVGWSAFGLYALLREGRVFSALPVSLLLLVGVFRLRGLWKKKAAVDALPASERVIDGRVEQTVDTKVADRSR
jgi:hypothetical protein